MINQNLNTPPLFQTLRRTEAFVSSYPTSGAAQHILDSYIELWGLSKYQLAGLLGLSHRSSFYRYSSGERRPSALMLIRLLQLELLHRRGCPLVAVKIIDWDSDPIVIYWHGGTKSSPDELTGQWAKVPHPDDGTPCVLLVYNFVSS